MSLIALGVTGGIGAYKAVEVARGLQKRGHDVTAVMTRSATKFVGELTFEAITRRPVITDQYARGMNADIEHIALASTIDLLLIAPATANLIGKMANGIADDSHTVIVSAHWPVVVRNCRIRFLTLLAISLVRFSSRPLQLLRSGASAVSPLT